MSSDSRLVDSQICSGANGYISMLCDSSASLSLSVLTLLLRSRCVSGVFLLHHSESNLHGFPSHVSVRYFCGSREVLLAGARPSLQKLWRVSDTSSPASQFLVTLHFLIRKQFLVFSCPCLIEDENNVKFVW